MPEPSTSHIGRGVALDAPTSSSRVHLRQNLSDSRNDTQLLRNKINRLKNLDTKGADATVDELG